MEVFRITTKKWANSLTASGYAARWNSNGIYMIYTASSRSLACLENLVHRNGIGLKAEFCVMLIDIPKNVSSLEINPDDLPVGWDLLDEKAHLLCRKIGDNWQKNQSSCILYVPSAIIKEEKNILINPNHRDFSKIKISKIDEFLFDDRFSRE